MYSLRIEAARRLAFAVEKRDYARNQEDPGEGQLCIWNKLLMTENIFKCKYLNLY
jgi:hypothetical protein